MTEYESIVEKCQKNRINRRITNTSIDHAAVLYKYLFIAAEAIPGDEPKTVRIQTGDARADFYEPLVRQAKQVMDSGVTINLMVSYREADVQANKFLAAVNDNPRGEVRINSERDVSIHFAVVGQSAYRIETDLDTFQAFANFNEPIIATRLIGLFDPAWDTAVPTKQAQREIA
ncbi:MAG TPA: hypothetical protein VII63_02585 [Caulobacteraceae bacterium]